MYDLLEKLVQGPKGNALDLREASRALQGWDLQRFKEIRSKILSDDALLHIFDFDPEEHHEAMIDEHSEHKTAEDHESMLRRMITRGWEIVEKRGLELRAIRERHNRGGFEKTGIFYCHRVSRRAFRASWVHTSRMSSLTGYYLTNTVLCKAMLMGWMNSKVESTIHW